jgi:redox-sensitive bicupin YhaK (pirin superfamily)
MAIAHLFKPHDKDLGGGFRVRRVLPAAAKQSVGPFLFFDHMGPVDAEPGSKHDVRPHPHIGLATVTYLFEGAIMHRDSLGTVQRIEPGAINWRKRRRPSRTRPPPTFPKSPSTAGRRGYWWAVPLAARRRCRR